MVTVSGFHYPLLDYNRTEGVYGPKSKGQAGLDQVLSVQVPTHFCFILVQKQYRLLMHMSPEVQQELTFASGLQGKSPAPERSASGAW